MEDSNLLIDLDKAEIDFLAFMFWALLVASVFLLLLDWVMLKFKFLVATKRYFILILLSHANSKSHNPNVLRKCSKFAQKHVHGQTLTSSAPHPITHY